MGQRQRIRVEIWVCRKCGNYYASSSAGDLTTAINVDKETKQPSFPRSRCPTPQCAAEDRQREPVTVYV